MNVLVHKVFAEIEIPRQPKTVEQDVSSGDVSSQSLDFFQTTLQGVFKPLFDNATDWGRSSKENTKEFLQLCGKFNDTLSEAARSLEGGIELRRPDKKYEVENKQQVGMMLHHCHL